MVPMLVVIYDAAPIYAWYSQTSVNFPGVAILFYWIGGFALFAFLTTLIREIIKDMEDCEGDRETGRKTLPVIVRTDYMQDCCHITFAFNGCSPLHCLVQVP